MVWSYVSSGLVGSGKCQLRVSPVVDWPLNGGQKMATPQDVTATYSFIGALMADPVLTPFGNVKRERDLIRAKSLRVYEDISDVPLNIG